MPMLMKCGHVANAVDSKGNPVCAICAGIKPGFDVPDRECEGTEGLEGRKATCPICGATTASSWDLPFFEYRPDKGTDVYYDGCMGWD